MAKKAPEQHTTTPNERTAMDMDFDGDIAAGDSIAAIDSVTISPDVLTGLLARLGGGEGA